MEDMPMGLISSHSHITRSRITLFFLDVFTSLAIGSSYEKQDIHTLLIPSFIYSHFM
jgi:hypothetical protein